MRKLILTVFNFNLFPFKVPHVASSYCIWQRDSKRGDRPNRDKERYV